ncbi:MAG: hypothetical protein AAFQ98_06270 [Bacteroidota bacterium]
MTSIQEKTGTSYTLETMPRATSKSCSEGFTLQSIGKLHQPTSASSVYQTKSGSELPL